MKLYYYNHAADPDVSPDFVNFGDDLNGILWDQLFPGAFDGDDSIVFSGIGSHLNRQFGSRFPASRHVVFGTGFGYGDALKRVGPDWKVYFVRGPLTAKSMGLPPTAAVTDAAMLVALTHHHDQPRDIPCAFMPHIDSITSAHDDWKRISDDLGMTLVDVRKPLVDVLNLISRTDVLLTEALHGAIVADAMRTRWVPLVMRPTISELKWNDWCSSVGVEYDPVRIPPLWGDTKPGGVARARRFLKYRAIRRRLAVLARAPHPARISADSTFSVLMERLQGAVAEFRHDQCLATADAGAGSSPSLHRGSRS